MDKPPEYWYCDVCGYIIENVSDGYVIWNTNDELKCFDFKIIHQIKCDSKSYLSSTALNHFLGVNGLVYLTSFLSIGPIKKITCQGSSKVILNIDEFVDFIRRVQIPYYEEARRKFAKFGVIENYSDSSEVSPYFPDILKIITEM
ncbi:MAG: hypothetical protein PHQ58_11740 [Rhodoferax sp.]|uniref:hypothetical protein n=1 Tax=Rhodoferax sp. TaxID=50421 RepID=UPI002603C4E2|nr:hypothetical protein [Rhodoferax sp.]MDD2881100.1 hypothetical protein [Rhodoferax sp.]